MHQSITALDSDSEGDESDVDFEIQRALRASREHYDRQHAHKRRMRTSSPRRARDFKGDNEVTVISAKGKEITRPSKPPPRTTQTYRSQRISDYYSKAPASKLHANPLISPPYKSASSSSSSSSPDQSLPLGRSDIHIDLADDISVPQSTTSQKEKANTPTNATNSTPFQQISFLDRTLGGLSRSFQQPTSDTVEGEL